MVHLDLTRRWAVEEGFSAEEAEAIARADTNVDRLFKGHGVLWHRSYHFAWAGAGIRARVLLGRACRTGDLVMLGRALHCVQDAIGHGFVLHTPAIDRWEERSPALRERIERTSREMLRRFRFARTVAAG